MIFFLENKISNKPGRSNPNLQFISSTIDLEVLSRQFLEDSDDEDSGTESFANGLAKEEQAPGEDKEKEKKSKKIKSNKESSQTRDKSSGDQVKIEQLQREYKEIAEQVIKESKDLRKDVRAIVDHILARDCKAFDATCEGMTLDLKESLRELMEDGPDFSTFWEQLKFIKQYMHEL
ncbi:hypothetical protein BOTCAL_0917g00020 [Botryotinia calthae]|uniref:Uncharacterized protein n=1 Tax=Botryotinia calthae TaxID=38488 RepID=A0A4Y8CEW1_9HELO|nr:hypothetical protein BOTCAL_0917g00020 [Botryotinia calthae]